LQGLEYCCSQLGIGYIWIKDEMADKPQLTGGKIQIFDRAQPGLLAGLRGIGKYLGDQDVEQVEYIIRSRCFKCDSECHEGCQTAIIRQALNCARLGRRGKPRERLNSAWRNTMGDRNIDSQAAYFFEPLERSDQFGRASPEWALAQTIKQRLMTTIPNVQERIQLRFRFRRNTSDQRGPQSLLHSHPNPRNMAFQDGGSWQQGLVRNEPCCGAIEQHAGLISACPAQSVKPSIESELDRAVRKIRVSASLSDPCRVVPSLPA
jgi:hypothetical protein